MYCNETNFSGPGTATCTVRTGGKLAGAAPPRPKKIILVWSLEGCRSAVVKGVLAVFDFVSFWRSPETTVSTFLGFLPVAVPVFWIVAPERKNRTTVTVFFFVVTGTSRNRRTRVVYRPARFSISRSPHPGPGGVRLEGSRPPGGNDHAGRIVLFLSFVSLCCNLFNKLAVGLLF